MEQTAAPANETPEHLDIRLNKDIAAFSYIWMMSLFIYMTKKESKFIQYHSKQGIVLFLLTIPVSFIPWVGKYLVFLIVAAMLLGFLNAANGQYRDVPCVGPLSRGELSVHDLLRLGTGGIQSIFSTLSSLLRKHLHRRSNAAITANNSVPAANIRNDVDKV
jgi:uncharacterized membrane protein